MPEDERPPFQPQLHEVVRDFGHKELGEPREGVYVGPGWSVKTVELRPLGENGGVWMTRRDLIEPLSPREIAPGTAGNPRRRPFDGPAL
ncbi:hypothetical protein ACIRVF_11375 [Kitasatospora sp. NPDC101157]|uniref:hypothetical protein n=1 Tax=Kitasatospora sp. NPDC101157 TaxID=3364098 RepID=UPI003810E58E